MSQFWIVGVPTQGTDLSASRKQFQQNVDQFAETKLFSIPDKLQVGTIDKLMKLSDDLSKFEPQIGALCKKIKRSYDDSTMQEPEADYNQYAKNQELLKDPKNKNKDKAPGQKKPLYITGGNTFDLADSRMLPRDYMNNFNWSEIAYGATWNIEKLKNDMASTFARTEDELKHRTAQLNECKTNVINYEKKINGNLLIRPISQFIKADQIINTPHFTTLIVAVPRAKEEEFLQQYELVESKYWAKLDQEEAARKQNEAKDEKKDAAAQKAAAAAKPEEEEEEEKPPSDEEIKAREAAAKAAATKTAAKPEEKPVVYTPHPTFGLSTDAKYQRVSTVVPGSALKLVGAEQAPQDDLSLFRIVCFKRYTKDEQQQLDVIKTTLHQGNQLTTQQQNLLTTSANVEKFKSVCRDARWTVRPFVYDPQEQQMLANEIRGYVAERKRKWDDVKTFCEESFDQVFRAWVHLIAMRAFVEIRLRYGLGNNWMSFIVVPKKNQEKKVRDTLAKVYTEKGTEAFVSSSGDDDYFPYVNINIDLADM